MRKVNRVDTGKKNREKERERISRRQQGSKEKLGSLTIQGSRAG